MPGSRPSILRIRVLPRFVHVRGVGRLAMLLGLVNEETRADRPGREVVLARLRAVLLIEVLRSTAGPTAPSGLLRGLADERVAAALRRMHQQPTAPWTVAALAREAGLSRSTFFERFGSEVGVAPMAYLLAWRIALAKDLLNREGAGVAEVAERVGYGSASTFSTASSRQVGRSPIQYARGQQAQSRSLTPMKVWEGWFCDHLLSNAELKKRTRKVNKAAPLGSPHQFQSFRPGFEAPAETPTGSC